MNGQGEISWQDGVVYNGQWKDGLIFGYGELLYDNNLYKGIWKKNELVDKQS